MLGVSIEGEEKNRLGVTSALSEIWDLAVFQSVHFFIKEENPENHGAKKRKKETHTHLKRSPRKTAFSGFLPADQSESAVYARSLSPPTPPCARARVCVCLQVFERLPKEEGRKTPRKEGWWTIQAVVRHKWWVGVLLLALLHFPKRQRAENAPIVFLFYGIGSFNVVKFKEKNFLGVIWLLVGYFYLFIW